MGAHKAGCHLIAVSVVIIVRVRILELEVPFGIHSPQFTGKAAESQTGRVTFPRSHSKLVSEASLLAPKSGTPRPEPSEEWTSGCGLLPKKGGLVYIQNRISDFSPLAP